jgi:hypothetical protein
MGKLFKGIKGTRASVESNYARPGRYIAMILDVRQGETRKGEDFVAIRKKGLEVVSAPGDNPHRVGEEWTDMLMASQDTFLPNFKRFALVMLGESDDESIDEGVAEEITGDSQPLSGLVVEVENIERVSQKTDKPYTRKIYKRVLPKEEVNERIDPDVLEKHFSQAEIQAMQEAYQALDDDS